MSAPIYHIAVQNLEKKLNSLLQRYKEQQQTIQQLQKKNIDLRQLLKQQNTNEDLTVQQLVEQLQVDTGSKSSITLASKLDVYIQEIDACIAHLEKA